MPDALTVGAILLVAGPVLGTLGLASDPGLYRVWTAPREEHLAIVRARRRSWRLANLGFVVATILTAAGLVIVAGALDTGAGDRAGLLAIAVAYALAGGLWCAVVAIRDRTTPLLADLVAAERPTEPAEALLGGAIGGLFWMFALVTSVALVALGLQLAVGGGVAVPVAGLAVLVGAVALAVLLRTGDLIPAVLYVPTLVLGIALLVGWT
jgi:hypothetical protein